MNKLIKETVIEYLKKYCTPGYKPKYMFVTTDFNYTSAQCFTIFEDEEKSYLSGSIKYELNVPVSLELGFNVYVHRSLSWYREF